MNKNDIIRLIEKHQSRLQILKEQSALQGISVDPKIPLEIKQIEKEIENLQRKLATLEEDTKENDLHHPTSPTTKAESEKPLIENADDHSLSSNLIEVLQEMFANYERVILKQAFRGGFSGGRVFLVRLIRSDGFSELPTVVKLASVSLIEKEWLAYQRFIHNRLPNNISMMNAPTILPDNEWAGLSYPLVGSGAFEIQSLFEYCQQALAEDISFVFDQLFLVMTELWRFNKVEAEFNLQISYDHLLPPNLFIELTTFPSAVTPYQLSPNTAQKMSFQQGDYVHIEGFAILKVDLNYQTIDLNLPMSSDGPATSFFIRAQTTEEIPSYKVGDVASPLIGIVKETRLERLHQEAKKTLGASITKTSQTVSLSDGTTLPNPLIHWQKILTERYDVNVGTIHGDLNLENILINLTTRQVNLIDFAAAREDHLLHDFFRLETEIVTKLISKILVNNHLPGEVIVPFYLHLHDVVALSKPFDINVLPHPLLENPFQILRTIRTTALLFLSKPKHWPEYYNGLTLYLLGAMKFGNLDRIEGMITPLPKQVAFWGAGGTFAILHQSSTGQESKKTKVEKPDIRKRLADSKEKSAFSKLLLECTAMSNPHNREDVITSLPKEVRNFIQRSRNDLFDTNNIVNRALDFEDGIETLVEIIRGFEGDSLPMRQIDEFLKKNGLSQ